MADILWKTDLEKFSFSSISNFEQQTLSSVVETDSNCPENFFVSTFSSENSEFYRSLSEIFIDFAVNCRLVRRNRVLRVKCRLVRRNRVLRV